MNTETICAAAPLRLGVEKPTKTVVPLADGLAWGDEPGWIYQEKLDGEFSLYEVSRGNVLACEFMPAKDHTGPYYVAIDCLTRRGEDLRDMDLDQRLYCRDQICREHLIDIVPTGRGGEFLRQVLARGGEGIVRKRLNATWHEPMQACKRNVILECRVTGRVTGTKAVTIADPVTGQDRGKVSLGGGKADQVIIGRSIIRVEGMCLHASGKIREPRLCTAWLVKS